MRRAVGVLIGIGLFFPGALVLRWLVVDELRLYAEMTLTDALLAMVIILVCALIFGQSRRSLSAEELEKQARKMELASRRLEKARRAYRSARSQSSRSSPSRRSDRSARASRSSSARSSAAGRREDSRRPRRSR